MKKHPADWYTLEAFNIPPRYSKKSVALKISATCECWIGGSDWVDILV